MTRSAVHVTLLLAVAVCVAGSVGAGGPGSGRPEFGGATPSGGAVGDVASPAPASPSPSPSPTPTPAPTPTPIAAIAWITGPTALLTEPGNEKSATAHVGAGFPVKPTSGTATVLGEPWLEVAWETPGRQGTAWVPRSALTIDGPAEAAAQASIDALDSDLSAYLSGIGNRIGVEVRDLTRGTVYTYNETHQYTTASSIKVPIMLAFLDKLEAAHREPTAREKSLLTTMIENSRDASATTLWGKIGGAAGLAAYMKRIGVTGLSPYSGGWSWSKMSPHAMAQVLTLLQDGSILNDAHRAYALYLMGHVQKSQRIGVADTAPAGAAVAMKIGRWWYDAKRGGVVMSSSGIVTLGSETYVISVYTDRNSSMPKAEATVRHACGTVAGLLLEGETA